MESLLMIFEGDDPVVEVFHEALDNTFICAVVGPVDLVQLKRIEEEILACGELSNGAGIYAFKCMYQSAEYCPESYGLIQGDDWHCEQVGFVSIDEEGEA